MTTKTVTVTRAKRKGRPSKLTEEIKDVIVNNYNNGDTQREIAEKFGVSITTIRNVIEERRI